MWGMNIVDFAFSITLQPLSLWTGTVMIHTSNLSCGLKGKLFDEARTSDVKSDRRMGFLLARSPARSPPGKISMEVRIEGHVLVVLSFFAPQTSESLEKTLYFVSIHAECIPVCFYMIFANTTSTHLQTKETNGVDDVLAVDKDVLRQTSIRIGPIHRQLLAKLEQSLPLRNRRIGHQIYFLEILG
jgi:hypothetical protein